jgi:hypothetical protein
MPLGHALRTGREAGWSPRLESNQYPTLRRHVHYPLCYGEDTRAAVSGTCGSASGPCGQAGIVNRVQL